MAYSNIRIKNNLRELRKKYMLRQIDLAKILGLISEVRISNWEKGKAIPGLINLMKLCALYEVSLKELYPDLYEKQKCYSNDYCSNCDWSG